MRSRTRVASASYSDSDTSPLSRSARARRARARAERRSRPRRTTRAASRGGLRSPANRPGTRESRVLGQRREAATGGGRRVVRTRRDDRREAETGGRGRHPRGRSATTGVVVTQRKRSTRRVVLSRRAEKYSLINSPWIRTVLSMTTSYINFFSLVIIDPENFRNDTPQLRYLQRRPRLSRTSDSRRGSTDTPDDYPTRRSTSASRVSYYRFSARGACPPRPPSPWKREKQAGHRLLQDSTSHGELERPRA